MKAGQRVQFSLTKPRVEKVIVCLGFGEGLDARESRGAVATRVTQHLLLQCRPSPSDVHNPDTTRAHARDRQGRARNFYESYTMRARRGRLGRTETLRSPQTWDSSRVVDYMGVWCDRLLLGDARYPVRCALLEPHVPEVMWGEAVARVAQSHRHLDSTDVLVVSACGALPFGVVRLCTDAAESGNARPPTSNLAMPGIATLEDALRLFTRSTSGPSRLHIGIGSEHGTCAPFAQHETPHVQRFLVPLCSFVAALWSVSPVKASEYVASVTATPETLTEGTANRRLWRTMQHSMLSTRDSAVLNAYYKEDVLDARLSRNHTRYLAETLLRRLADEDSAA
ncbi:hypothetical protein conserved [Leishmania donovani]|uniref:Hypothetical_protein_conserved n=1 Tax=Leishmania donovani TaxID=5661 RepID=A0A504Y412_LEIDO|nr:hypothetical protein CGC20_11335 [Leishmania donovani]CAJ1991984.1 hypothetical protein conserved [Leishmania donovani]VDZ47821.1 hypothetical_protein_conserved [Leishmania donovani]